MKCRFVKVFHILTAIGSSDTIHRGSFAAVERITNGFALPTVTTPKEHEMLPFIALCEQGHAILGCLVKTVTFELWGLLRLCSNERAVKVGTF